VATVAAPRSPGCLEVIVTLVGRCAPAADPASWHLPCDNEIDIAAARGLILQACWELDQQRSASQAVSIAKTFTAEAVWRVVDRSLQLCGALGVSGDILLGRFLREVRPFRIYDGPSETHRWSIARRTVARHAATGTATPTTSPAAATA
jgi:acyl-CoA dehydrogenase